MNRHLSHAMNCDLCGSREHVVVLRTRERQFGYEGEFEVARCTKCDLVRTQPQPADLAAFYPSDGYYSYEAPRRPSALTRDRVRRFYRLPVIRSRWATTLASVGADRLTPGLPPGPPGKLLDVGCGSGEMLLALQEAGWNCHGVEFDPGAVKAAREAGLTQIILGDLLGIGYPERAFDAVRFWHSLEHLRSPRAALVEAFRILRPGGSLTIGVPNFASLLSRVFGDRWYFLDVPRHLWHFQRKTLTALVTQVGFEIIRIRIVSTSTPLLGTARSLLPLAGSLSLDRRVWLATLPLAMLLDRLQLGDAIELTARVPR